MPHRLGPPYIVPPGVSGMYRWITTPMSALSVHPGERSATYCHIHLPPAHLHRPEQTNPLPVSNIIHVSTGVIASSARDANTAMYAQFVRSPIQNRSVHVLKAQQEKKPCSSARLAHSMDVTVK